MRRADVGEEGAEIRSAFDFQVTDWQKFEDLQEGEETVADVLSYYDPEDLDRRLAKPRPKSLRFRRPLRHGANCPAAVKVGEKVNVLLQRGEWHHVWAAGEVIRVMKKTADVRMEEHPHFADFIAERGGVVDHSPLRRHLTDLQPCPHHR